MSERLSSVVLAARSDRRACFGLMNGAVVFKWFCSDSGHLFAQVKTLVETALALPAVQATLAKVPDLLATYARYADGTARSPLRGGAMIIDD